MRREIKSEAPLLPCPFCNGKPDMHEENLDERCGYAHIITIGCRPCRVNMSTGSKEDKNGWNNEPTSLTMQRAVENWNRRHADTGGH